MMKTKSKLGVSMRVSRPAHAVKPGFELASSPLAHLRLYGNGYSMLTTQQDSRCEFLALCSVVDTKAQWKTAEESN